MVERYFNNDWRLALRSFVLNPKNRWCPTWVARNYEIKNEVIRGFPIESMPIPKCSSRTDTTGPLKDADDANAFPHAKNFNTKFIFSGEPE
jgi:hypothetical protein